MDFITFLSNFIDSVAWPISIVVLAMIFRSPISELIQVLKKLKYKDFEIEFDLEAKKLHAEVAKELPYREIIDDEDMSEKNKLLQLSQISPHAAILNSWSQVENEAFLAVKRLKPELAGKEINNWLLVIHTLLSDGRLDGEKFKQFRKLGSLRNQIAHNIDLPISQEGALEYIESALILKRHLKNINS